jgi:hypothetical protein
LRKTKQIKIKDIRKGWTLTIIHSELKWVLVQKIEGGEKQIKSNQIKDIRKGLIPTIIPAEMGFSTKD